MNEQGPCWGCVCKCWVPRTDEQRLQVCWGNPGAMRRKVWVLGLTQLAPPAGPFQKGSESCLEQVNLFPGTLRRHQTFPGCRRLSVGSTPRRKDPPPPYRGRIMFLSWLSSLNLTKRTCFFLSGKLAKWDKDTQLRPATWVWETEELVIQCSNVGLTINTHLGYHWYCDLGDHVGGIFILLRNYNLQQYWY